MEGGPVLLFGTTLAAPFDERRVVDLEQLELGELQVPDAQLVELRRLALGRRLGGEVLRRRA